MPSLKSRSPPGDLVQNFESVFKKRQNYTTDATASACRKSFSPTSALGRRRSCMAVLDLGRKNTRLVLVINGDQYGAPLQAAPNDSKAAGTLLKSDCKSGKYSRRFREYYIRGEILNEAEKEN